MSPRFASGRLALAAMLVVAAPIGCVDVPASMRAQFAGPGPQDRSNYRPGRHGAAPPVDEPAPETAAAPAEAEAGAPSAADAAVAEVAVQAALDGGAAPEASP